MLADDRAQHDLQAMMIENLKAIIVHLKGENVAMREIVEAVAAIVWSSYCPWCNRHGVMHEVEHYEDCPVLAARALTGVTPDTDDEE